MAFVLSAPMFYMNNKFVNDAMNEKYSEITDINASITKMILDKKSAVLSNAIQDMGYIFSGIIKSYEQQNRALFEREVLHLYDNSFANFVDVFFFESIDGNYIFDASTPFYDTSMIKSYMMANRRFLLEGTRIIQSESQGGTLIALTGSSEVVSPETGELVGYFYVGIILNNSSGIINEIMQATNISEAALVFGDSVISGSVYNSQEEIIKACYNQQHMHMYDSYIAHCSDINLNTGGISLKFYQSLPYTFANHINAQNKKMGYTAIVIVLIVTIITGYIINVLTVRTLYRLIDYTQLQLSSGNAEYHGSIIKEFNTLADQISDVSLSLTETQAYMENLLNSASAPIAVWDNNGNIKVFNSALEKLSGYDTASVAGKHLSHIYNIFPQATVPVLTLESEAKSNQFESTVTHKDTGVMRHVLWNVTDVYNDRKYTGTIIQGSDITEIKEAEAKMMLASKVFANTMDGMLIVSKDGFILECNDAFIQMSGYDYEEIIGMSVRSLRSGLHPDSMYGSMWDTLSHRGAWSGEVWQRKKDGDIYPSIMNISSIKEDDSDDSEYVAVIHDITERKRYEEKITYQANHDGLTGLPNKNFFTTKLAEQIEKHDGIGGIGVLFLDLDRFKNLNDTLGHTTGDKVLQIIAERIKNSVRESTFSARFSGDEFTIMFTDLKGSDDAVTRAKKIIARISAPVTVQGYELFIQTSAGLCFFPENGRTATELIKNAEISMYQAKMKGRNNIQQFTAGLDESLRDKLIVESKLNRAIENNELSLYYQPKIDLSTETIMGMEALIRWNNPELGFVSPDKFIPLAEENGLILPIGEWVINQALADTARLHDEGFGDLKVAVNLSLRQFMQKDIAQTVRSALLTSGIEKLSFEFEITENIFTEDLSTITKVMQDISELDIKFAIDDFGTGYSSIGYLKKMPISTIKIDRSYISTMDTNRDNESIVSSVILMSKSLGLNIVAEGAETSIQVEMLKEMGCNIVQGFYYGRPMPYDEFLDFCKNWK